MSESNRLQQDFYGLTPDHIMQAAELAGIRPTGAFLQLNSLENRVYSIAGDDGNEFVLKFYRPGRWTDAQILEEHAFCADLATSRFPVCAPLAFGSGSTLAHAEGLRFAAWKREKGRIPDEFDSEGLSRLGALIAQLHETGFARPAEQRLRLSSETYIQKSLSTIESLCGAPGSSLSRPLFERYAQAAQAAAAMLATTLEGLPFGRIHGDLHWGNLLVSGEDIRFLDFDDFVMGPAVQDIWMLAPAVDAIGLAQRARLLEGYRTVRAFDERWLDAVNPLKAARYIRYAAWIAERRDDPAFKQTFPQFGTSEYWEQETEDLEALLRDSLPVQELPQKLRQEYEEAQGLTNKDYFWDL